MIYVVKPGDSLAQIAREYGVSEARIRSDNGLLVEQPLVPGQALVVLIPQQTYRVQTGDTLSNIAASAGMTVAELLQNNPTVTLEQPLVPGEILTLRLAGEKEMTMTVGGYVYPYVNQTVLERSMPFLTNLFVFSYGFREDGTLVGIQDRGLLAQGRAFGTGMMLVLASIDENGSFSSRHVSHFLKDETRQNRALEALIQEILEKGYRGLDVDFEYIPEEDKEAFFAFLGKARDLLHPNGLILQVALAPKTHADQPGLLYAAHDYEIIGAIADEVLLMTYEWGYTYGPPMAVAPLQKVKAVLEYGVSEIPPWKIQMGIPNYGYHWTLPYNPNQQASILSNQEAVLLAAQEGAEIHFDQTAQSPTFRYIQGGETHQVWFEDARSIQAKLRLAQELGLHGVTYWNLMRPFAQNWALLSELVQVRRWGHIV